MSPDATSEGFEWEWRLLEAADLIAEQKGHLWLAVSAAEGSSWRHHLPFVARVEERLPP